MQDFAKKTKPKKNNTLSYRLLNLGLLVLLVAGVYLLYQQWHHKKKPQMPPPASTQHARLASHTKKPKNSFDFYSLLQKTSSPNALTGPKNTAQFDLTSFYLQLAVTTSKPGADHLVEKLGTEGYSAFIKNNNHPAAPRYTVLVGPFNDLSSAQLNQNLLHKNKIESILIKPTQNTKNTTSHT
jgi:cell division septation protein DedD